MATEKWIAGSGAGLTWTSLDTTTLNSIANGNAILSGTQIDNSTALDIFADVELVLASLAAVAPNYVGVYFYPLNSDGTTYGDGRFGSSAAGPPPGQYAMSAQSSWWRRRRRSRASCAALSCRQARASSSFIIRWASPLQVPVIP
jgi:hypothetical protein